MKDKRHHLVEHRTFRLNIAKRHIHLQEMVTPVVADTASGGGRSISPPPSNNMPSTPSEDDTGQKELQQLLEQAFRKGVADGKKRELRRVFGQIGFNAPAEKSKLRDMRALFNDNVKYLMQNSVGTKSLNGGIGGNGGAEEGKGVEGFGGGTYDSRGMPRRRSPPPPSGYGSREGTYGSREAAYGMEGTGGSGGRDGSRELGDEDKQLSLRDGRGMLTNRSEWRLPEDDVVSPAEGVTMPKNLKKGGDIRVVKHFGTGDHGGTEVYDSRGRVVGRSGEYDSRGRKKPDKTHVSLGLNFKVHLSPKDGKMLSKVVGDKKEKKEKKGRKRRGRKGSRGTSTQGSGGDAPSNDDSESEEEEKKEKPNAKAKVAGKILKTILSKYGIGE